ncbi:hypothetical protein Cgig2_000062 [Carnegiea gigantea]|uniref:Sm domain-containing protein n=1 Tax=Carnegiea gigantea TaxID=171969 RepID=A0A9Q1QRB9_9CARY|nr:hypothetical protein Cgig2_000062 [Carnegiea gigantea]
MTLFFSYFKEIVGREVVVELKNDLAIRGTLRSVDQYLNIKLENTRVVDQDKYPHMGQMSVRNCFIRGSVVRYVQLPPDGVDVELLHDATRREARGNVVRTRPDQTVQSELVSDPTWSTTEQPEKKGDLDSDAAAGEVVFSGRAMASKSQIWQNYENEDGKC